MKKRKNIAIPMILAATIAAVSVPCSSQIVMASDTYQVGVSKGYLALRSAMAYDSSNEIGELYSGDTVEVIEYQLSERRFRCERESGATPERLRPLYTGRLAYENHCVYA